MDLQIDLLAAFVFIGWPVYQLLAVSSAWSAKDEAFYQYLASQSRLFPSGWARVLFPLMWTILWPLNGVGAYLFWHAYAVGDDTVWLVGIIFYIVFFVVSCAWMRIFFRMQAIRFAFLITFIFIWGGALAYCICAWLYPQYFAAVASTVLVVWLTYALLLTGAAAYITWPFHHKRSYDDSSSSSKRSFSENDWDPTGVDKRVTFAASAAQTTPSTTSMTPPASNKPFGVASNVHVRASAAAAASVLSKGYPDLVMPPPQ